MEPTGHQATSETQVLPESVKRLEEKLTELKKYRDDYQPPVHLVDSLKIRSELAKSATTNTFKMQVRVNPESISDNPLAEPFFLNGQGIPEAGVPKKMPLKSLIVNARKLEPKEYSHTVNGIYIHNLERFVDADGSFEVEVSSEVYPDKNTSNEGLYASDNLLTTQMEPEGFRNFGFFPDRPDVLSSYEVTLVGDPEDYPVMLSNGDITNDFINDNGQREITFSDPHKKPCYLFAAVAGDLVLQEDTFTTRSGREVKLEMWVEPKDEGRGGFALEALKRAMKWDEVEFDREYDLDTLRMVAVDSFNQGAMENKGLMIFNSASVLADPDLATDEDYDRIEATVAHEYFHNWRGNRVTIRSWHEISEKEGLTRFTDRRYSASLKPAVLARVGDVLMVKNRVFSEDDGPNAHAPLPKYIEAPNSAYTATTYLKGAEINRMVELVVGTEAYKAGLNLFFKRFDGCASKMEDILDCVQEQTQQDLSQFRSWLTQSGSPYIDVSTRYDRDMKEFVLTLKQTVPSNPAEDHEPKNLLDIPFGFGLVTSEGNDLEIVQIADDGAEIPLGTSPVLRLTEKEQEWRFKCDDLSAVPSLNRGFTSPSRIRYQYRDQDLLHLLEHDNDDFNRWESGQILMSKAIKDAYIKVSQGKDLSELNFDEDLLEAFGAILANPDIDNQFKALMFNVPSVKEILQGMNPVDLILAKRVRDRFRTQIAERYEEKLYDLYEKSTESQYDHFSREPEQIGFRAIKRTCLSFLNLLEDDQYAETALYQLKNANNLTDRLAAMSALSNRDSQQKRLAYEEFHDKWNHENVLVPKWLGMTSATAKGENISEVLDSLDSLADAEGVNLDVPNHQRGLYGAFTSNIELFHHESGEGYRWLVDKIIEVALIRKNNLVAGMLTKSFEDYPRLDDTRKALAGAQLERLLATEGMPKEVIGPAKNLLKAGKETA
ncbi:MAG: aminopeptidase N [Bdellovibrionota bacterium]